MNAKSRLEEISIRGLGVIENSTLEFAPGFNVLTGETGAGKTMILTAIGLVLGGKSDTTLIRHGAARAIVSSTFRVEGSKEHDEYCDGDSLILSRTINEDGKSKASAGGVTVAASVLQQLSEGLIEIHGQSANQNLTKGARQRELLDAFGGERIAQPLHAYQRCYQRYLELSSHIASMKESAKDREKRIKELEDFLKAGNTVKPKNGEIEILEGELSRLSSVEEIRISVSNALANLDGEDAGAYSSLSTAQRYLGQVSDKDPALKAISQHVTESFHILSEALHDLTRYMEGLEADPVRLEALQMRKAELAAFLKRFGAHPFADSSLQEVISQLKAARNQLNDLTGGDDRISELVAELHGVEKELQEAGIALSRARSEAAIELSKKVTTEIQSLSMPHTVFRTLVESVAQQETFVASRFTTYGCDDIAMEIQNQSDGPFLPIMKSASGGELSRIMLALEVVLAESSPVGTYIFDEVDAGVGGKAAIEVGRRLAQLAKQSQVIVVTHLPQVAAWATTHFTVEKESDGRVVSSGVHQIEGEARVEEIARMLAGLGESTSAREHAAELLALRTSA